MISDVKLFGLLPRLAAFTAVAALGLITVEACSTDAALAALAGTCAINSDCTSPYVCAFQACHEACTQSRDCAMGEDCVLSSDPPLDVCQLPAQTTCNSNSSCPQGEICAIDARCRDQCDTSRDCVSGQTCVSGACADPNELVDGGLPASGSSSVDASTGLACVYSSECPGALYCLHGVCAVECVTAKDCSPGWSCAANVCTLPDASALVSDSGAPAHAKRERGAE